MKNLFPLWFIIIVFAQPLFLVTCYQLGIAPEGVTFKIYLGGSAIISLLFYSLCTNKKVKSIDNKLLFVYIIFGMLYYFTSVKYGYANMFHTGHLLRWGAQCVPATLMGLTISRYKNPEKINIYIPFAVIILTPFIASASLRGGHDVGQYVDEASGLNYQVISYYMAILFGTTSYYLFFATEKIKSKLLNYLMYANLIIQVGICAMSGGRGGFILLCIEIIYLIYMAFKKRQISRNKIILMLITSISAFLILASWLNLWSSSGFQRVINPLGQQTGRKDDWEEVITYFLDSPFWGNGFGSDFYTWGFYSHNIIVDFLAEGGAIGCLILITIFYKVEKHIFKSAFKDNLNIFFAIFALYGLILNMFSGYWISTYPNWLIFGITWGHLHNAGKTSIRYR